MLEGLGGGDVFEVGERSVAEGASGGGKPDLLDLGGGAAAEALVDGVVLGVDRKERDVVLASGFEDEVAGGDEALLVGEADGLAGEDGGVGGFEAGNADDGGNDEAGGGKGGYADGAGGAVRDFDAGDVVSAEVGGEAVGEGFGGEGDDLRTPAEGLREGEVVVAAGGEGDGLEVGGVGVAEAEGALADGAGGAEDGDLLH
jgi:hypothetical protein